MSLIATVLEPLTHDEERERLHLERKVERAFYEAGLALRTLKERRLWRSTHLNFREYCQDRFGFGKSAVYYLMKSVEIVDNLQKIPLIVEKSSNSEQLNSTNNPLPTSETQCRPLAKLKPEQQRQAWNKAVEIASGVPSAKIVRQVVSEIEGHKAPKPIDQQKNSKPKIEYVPIDNPQIGQQVRICHGHPLFPEVSGTITQLPNRSSAVVELNNSQQRELISLKDLEIQRIVDGNGHATSPRATQGSETSSDHAPFLEGINHVRGVGVEWYVRLDEETWHKLDQYAQQEGIATLGGAIRRLLDETRSP